MTTLIHDSNGEYGMIRWFITKIQDRLKELDISDPDLDKYTDKIEKYRKELMRHQDKFYLRYKGDFSDEVMEKTRFYGQEGN